MGDEVKAQMLETEKKLEAQKHGWEDGDLASERKVEVDILADLEAELGTGGKTTDADDYNICYKIDQVIRDLVGDQKCDVEKLNHKKLKNMKLDPEVIDVIEELMAIRDEVSNGQHVDKNKIIQ